MRDVETLKLLAEAVTGLVKSIDDLQKRVERLERIAAKPYLTIDKANTR